MKNALARCLILLAFAISQICSSIVLATPISPPTIPSIPGDLTVSRPPAIANPAVEIAAGHSYSLAVAADGTLWVWGESPFGTLASLMTPFPALNQARKASANAFLAGEGTVVMMADGSVRALGSGHLEAGSQVLELDTLDGATQAASGGEVLIVARDGAVWSSHSEGTPLQISGAGNSYFVWDWSLGPIPGLSDMIKVASLQKHGMALDRNGQLWAWDLNMLSLPDPVTYGPHEGRGDSDEQSYAHGTWRPTPYRLLDGVADIAACGNHAIVVKRDGTVWQWSRLTSDSPIRTPTQVTGLSNVTTIAAGPSDFMAITSNGNVLTWGTPDAQAVTSTYTLPSQVGGLSNITQVAVGEKHFLALSRDGIVWTWGQNDDGQLGNGSHEASLSPVIVPLQIVESCSPAPSSDTAANNPIVTAGWNYSFARKEDGSLWHWGQARPSDDPILIPSPFDDLRGAKEISPGNGTGVAIKEDGSVLFWGSIGVDLLGEGHPTSVSRPTPIPSITQAKSVSTGGTGFVVLRQDGTVWSSHAHKHGSTYLSGQVEELHNIVQVDAGGEHFLALTQDGDVWGWGNTANGQIAMDAPTIDDSGWTDPYRLSDLTDIQAIAAGEDHSLALGRDGLVWAWGANEHGELGNGYLYGSSRNLPSVVLGLSNVAAIAAGSDYSLALRIDGNVYAWGHNDSGQLGSGAWVSTPLYTRVQLPSVVRNITAGDSHALAVDETGQIWGWGDNRDGAVGDGTLSLRISPVPVYLDQPSAPGASAITSGRLDLVASAPANALGEIFTVDVKVQGAKDIIGVDFTLLYPADIIQIVQDDLGRPAIAPREFLVESGLGTRAQIGTRTADNQAGMARLAVARKQPGVNGDGTLATVTFRRTSLSDATLLLGTGTLLLNTSLQSVRPLLGPSVTVRGLGSAGIGVVVGTALLEDQAVGTSTISIRAGGVVSRPNVSGQYIFDGLAPGEHQIVINAPNYITQERQVRVLPGKLTEVENVVLLRDIDGDDQVGLIDLGILVQSFNVNYGADPRADLSGDLAVTNSDLVLLQERYGQHGPLVGADQTPVVATSPPVNATPPIAPPVLAPAVLKVDGPPSVKRGQEFTITTTLNNTSTVAKEYTIRADLPDDMVVLNEGGSSWRKISVAANSSRQVKWLLKGSSAGDKLILFEAVAKDAGLASETATITVKMTQ
ncbi:MAG: hypothetical protein ACM3ZQ_09175 [Bacillota bacterium]